MRRAADKAGNKTAQKRQPRAFGAGLRLYRRGGSSAAARRCFGGSPARPARGCSAGGGAAGKTSSLYNKESASAPPSDAIVARIAVSSGSPYSPKDFAGEGRAPIAVVMPLPWMLSPFGQ